jgi:ribulose-phosphate 3-epimerase
MIEIAPSILAADFANLSRDIARVEKGGADLIHLDIMDGHFVPNITIGPPVVNSIRKITSLPLDAHLMIEEPSRYLDVLIQAGVNWISVHLEADTHLERTISYLRERGIRAGVALNPATPLGGLEEILPEVDFVLLMSVNPGFGGQQFIPSTLNKIRKLKELISSNGYKARIEVDGGIGTENLQEVLSAGAEIIVMGSAIFGANWNATDVVAKLKAITDRHLQSALPV